MKKIMLILALSAILLSSCFIPDNYEAEVWVHQDGSYEFFYNGELVYAPAVEKVLNGEFGDKDLDEMLKISDDLSKSEGFMEAEYLKGGRIRVDVIMPMLEGEDYSFMSEDLAIFTFKHNEKGHLVIKGLDLENEDLSTLRSFNIDMNGSLTVIADKGVKVASNNATKKVKDKKKGTSYIWKLDINSEQPVMVVK